MRKNKKSGLSNSFGNSTGFWIAVVLLFLCAIVHFLLFYNSFFRSLSKMNEEPIATITFKYKTAQRKFLDRNVWDRLRQNSPVYNGDTIHTSAMSEATIWFSDGNVMELSESTMAQVFLNDDNTLLAELEGGSAVLDSTGAEGGITLKSGGVEVAIEGGSSLSAGVSSAEDGGELQNASFQVLKGSASVTDGGKKGESRKMDEGESVNVQVASQNAANPNASKSSRMTVPLMTVLSPSQNQKFLYHSQGKFDVIFSWSIGNPLLFKDSITVTVASDKNFKNVIEERTILNPVSENCTVSLEPQIYYWKITSDTEKSESEEKTSKKSKDTSKIISSGKIQVVQSLPPELIAPVENYSYSYRIKNPAVRLIWDESAFATSYLIEVATSKSFENPVFSQRASSTSSIIGTLSEGRYFWRVTPYYTINKIGYSAPSKTGSFSIEKKNELKKPVLLTPANKAIVNTNSPTGSISFSWKIDPDAEDYNVIVSEKEDLSKPFINKTVRENYLKIDTSSIKTGEGRWYWTVTSRDSEGNVSPASDSRFVYAMKGKPEQHTIEPSNGFKVSQSLLVDTKFTWKKNLPENFESEIEISSDASFSNIVFSQKVNASSITINPLSAGSYYWRLKSVGTFSEEDEKPTEIVTLPKEFIVVGNLGSSELLAPEEKIVARETTPVEFKWNPVEGADFYKFFIYADSGALLYSDTLYETEKTIEMFSGNRFSDGAYLNIQVQPNAMEIPGVSSRRVGSLSTKHLLFRKLQPVSVDFPAQNQVLDGTEAILNPVKAVWSSVDDVSEAQFVFYKVENRKKIEIMRVPSDTEFKNGKTPESKIAPNKIVLDAKDGLRDGTYQIAVFAKTLDGIDISNNAAKHIRTFKIAPIPHLEASKNLKESPKIFDAEYIRNRENPKKIALEWEPVSNATEYVVSIFKDERGKKNGRLLFEKTLYETTYSIDFLSIDEAVRAELANGNFTWTVEGRRRYDTDGDGIPDKILQVGDIAKSSFTTSIPIPRKTQVKGAVNPYGQ